jgi:hypothetical protein
MMTHEEICTAWFALPGTIGSTLRIVDESTRIAKSLIAEIGQLGASGSVTVRAARFVPYQNMLDAGMDDQDDYIREQLELLSQDLQGQITAAADIEKNPPWVKKNKKKPWG